MKKSLALISGVMLFVACNYDDTELWNKVNDLDSSLKSLTTQVNELNSAYQAIAALLSGGVITNVEEVTDNGRTGYKLTVKELSTGAATTYTIWNGSDGADGSDGQTPVLGVALDASTGLYYWTVTVNGATTALKDDSGNYIYASGDKGADGLTPKLKIEEEKSADGSTQNSWYVGYDTNGNGNIDDEEWEYLGVFSGNVASSNVSVSVDDNTVTITVGEETYSFKLYENPLGISFDSDVSEGLEAEPYSTTSLGYTLTGATEDAIVLAYLQKAADGFSVEVEDDCLLVTAGASGASAVVVVSVLDGPNSYHTSFVVSVVSVEEQSVTKIEYTNVTTSFTETEEPYGTEALYDGDTGTYWHSWWSEYVTTDEWGVYLDITLDEPLNSVSFRILPRYHNSNIYGAPTKLQIGVSNDGKNFTTLGTAETGLENYTEQVWWDGQQTIFQNEESFKYLRFGVIESFTEYGQNSLVNMEDGYDYTSMAELEIYTLSE